ncbi:MAG: PadR family transcriptional regulator [Candidatus Micrarchaeia archaeon]
MNSLARSYKKPESKTAMPKGILSIVVLAELKRKPMHGYALEKEIEKDFGKVLKSGVIYIMLKTLERRKCVQAREEINSKNKKIKVYSITPHGAMVLLDHYAIISSLYSITGKILRDFPK